MILFEGKTCGSETLDVHDELPTSVRGKALVKITDFSWIYANVTLNIYSVDTLVYFVDIYRIARTKQHVEEVCKV